MSWVTTSPCGPPPNACGSVASVRSPRAPRLPYVRVQPAIALTSFSRGASKLNLSSTGQPTVLRSGVSWRREMRGPSGDAGSIATSGEHPAAPPASASAVTTFANTLRVWTADLTIDFSLSIDATDPDGRTGQAEGGMSLSEARGRRGLYALGERNGDGWSAAESASAATQSRWRVAWTAARTRRSDAIGSNARLISSCGGSAVRTAVGADPVGKSEPSMSSTSNRMNEQTNTTQRR